MSNTAKTYVSLAAAATYAIFTTAIILTMPVRYRGDGVMIAIGAGLLVAMLHTLRRR